MFVKFTIKGLELLTCIKLIKHEHIVYIKSHHNVIVLGFWQLNFINQTNLIKLIIVVTMIALNVAYTNFSRNGNTLIALLPP